MKEKEKKAKKKEKEEEKKLIREREENSSSLSSKDEAHSTQNILATSVKRKSADYDEDKKDEDKTTTRITTTTTTSANTNTTRIVVSGNGAVALEIINALDESFLQMVMSFVKAELERAVGGKNHHYHRRRRMMIEALKRMQVVWVVKHESIGDALFDRDTSAFLLEHRRARRKTTRRKILGEIEEARVKRVNKNDNGDNHSRQRGEKEETTTSIKKESDATTEKQFTFDEKISYPRRRGAFGATLRAKTSSAGPDWFKRINASLHFDDIFDDEKDAIEVKMKRKEEFIE